MEYLELYIIIGLIITNVVTFIWLIHQKYISQQWEIAYEYMARCYDDILKEYGVLGGDEEK